jgi:hypothetical protein
MSTGKPADPAAGRGTSLRMATTVVRTLAEAYGIDYQVVPFGDADGDIQRAVSDLAPLVTGTAAKRYVFVEQRTLRDYAHGIDEALGEGLVHGAMACTDVWRYDTRAGADLDHTCLALAIGDYDGPSTDDDTYVVMLTAPASIRERYDGDPGDAVGGGRTVRMVLDENAALERVAFALSRADWAARQDDHRQSAARAAHT